jgi:hypothetical protein
MGGKHGRMINILQQDKKIKVGVIPPLFYAYALLLFATSDR